MDGKQLRNSILQWAIQGKLVPQDPNDEPASVLLERIREEKARLVKEKKIKRDKNESIIYRGDDNSYYEKFSDGKVVCIDNEIPFEIPESWQWCRMSHLFLHASGKQQSSSNKGDGTPQKFITTSNLYWGRFVLDNVKVMNFTEEEIKKCSATKGDLLVCEGGAGYGRSAIWDKEYDICLQNHVHRLRPLIDGLCEYVYHFIYLLKESNQLASVGTAMPGLSANRLKGLLLPLPPYQEQRRIVSKLKKVIPYVEKYSETEDVLSQLNSDIRVFLKKNILQEAIQGKLVSQNVSDEPASVLLERIKAEKERLIKEKKIKRDKQDSIIYRGDDNKYYENLNGEVIDITDQIPFDIPTSWRWVRLEMICLYIQRGKSPKYSPIKQFPVVAQKCNQWSGFSLEKALFIDPKTVPSYQGERILQNGDLLWNSTGLGTLGRMAIYRSDLNPYGWAVADSHVTVIRPMPQIVSDYLFAYFASPTVQTVIEDKADGSTKQKELATSTIKGYYVPLPPTNEQMRIVQRIKTLFQSLN